MRNPILEALIFAALAGCTATGQVQYGGQVTAPNLVYVSPGVQVIADYDEPVFYNESFYWRFSGGVWYRSRHHTRDWVRVEVVPVAIRRIDRPTAYIRYRANARAEVRQPAPSPTVKDQRKDDRREEKELQKEERKEQKDERKEQKDERKEQKEVMKDERKELKDERKELKDERKEQKDERKEQKDERKEQKDERKEDRKNAKKPTH